MIQLTSRASDYSTRSEETESVSMIQTVTFQIGPTTLGIPISSVREITRQVDITRVPLAPAEVRGVINLRGDVITLLDLRMILGMGQTEAGPKSRNVIVQDGNQAVGLLVDQVSDIRQIPADHLTPPPGNVGGMDVQFFESVYNGDHELIVVLNLAAVLGCHSRSGDPAVTN